MANIHWIKLSTQMFDDEKIDFIQTLPEADAITVIWVRLLTMAGKCNAGGFIMLTESIPYTDEMLANKFRKPLNTVRMALDVFNRLNLVQISSDGTIYIVNWDEYIRVIQSPRVGGSNYDAWRNSVFIRDSYTCQKCKSNKKQLNAHHKIRWVDSEELRYDVENGITLCINCHKEEHRNRPPRKTFNKDRR